MFPACSRAFARPLRLSLTCGALPLLHVRSENVLFHHFYRALSEISCRRRPSVILHIYKKKHTFYLQRLVNPTELASASELLLVVLPTAQAVPRYWLAGQDVLQAAHEYPAVVEPVR